MSFRFQKRMPQSRFVEQIWFTIDETDGIYVATADGCWDLIFTRSALGGPLVRLSGPSSGTTEVHYQKGNQNIGIKLKPGAFFTHIPVREAMDTTEILPLVGSTAFLLGGHRLAIPAYNEIDAFIVQLETLGLLSEDPMVRSVLEGVTYGASKRTVERHFSQSVGVTPGYLAQIARAQEAVKLLQAGKSAAEVAAELGYTDQSHLTHNVKRVTGFTPKQNAQRNEPVT